MLGGKFKIMETQNKSSQKNNKFSISAQDEMQIELVFVKVPKLWQIFGKIKFGVKICGKFLAKLASGNPVRPPNSEEIFKNLSEKPTERQWTRGESNPRPTLTDRTAFT